LTAVTTMETPTGRRRTWRMSWKPWLRSQGIFFSSSSLFNPLVWVFVLVPKTCKQQQFGIR